MMWIIVLTLFFVSGIIVYYLKNNSNIENSNNQYSKEMLNSYKYLIAYLTQYPANKLEQVTSDTIIITGPFVNTYIENVGNDTHISLQGFIPEKENIDQNWVFDKNHPQQKIIDEIEHFLHQEMEKTNIVLSENDFFRNF